MATIFNEKDVINNMLDKIESLIDLEKQELFIDLKKHINSSNDNINLNLEDLFKALSHKGQIKGCSSISNLENIEKDIFANIDFKEVSNSKCALFFFVTNPNISLFTVNDIMMNIDEKFSFENETIIGTNSDENIKEDEIKYLLLFTGIENNVVSNKEDYDLEKLVYENRVLKEENERMKNTLLGLKLKG